MNHSGCGGYDVDPNWGLGGVGEYKPNRSPVTYVKATKNLIGESKFPSVQNFRAIY